MPERLVRYEAEKGIAWIELDSPPANAYSYEMMRQLDDAVLQARFDPEVRGRSSGWPPGAPCPSRRRRSTD